MVIISSTYGFGIGTGTRSSEQVEVNISTTVFEASAPGIIFIGLAISSFQANPDTIAKT